MPTVTVIITSVIGIIILLIVFLILNRKFGLKKIVIGKVTLEADGNNIKNTSTKRERKKLKNQEKPATDSTKLILSITMISIFTKSIDRIKEDYLERKRRLTNDIISNLFFELRNELKSKEITDSEKDLLISNLDSGTKSLRISIENIIYKNHLAARDKDLETKQNFLTLKSNSLHNDFKEDFDNVSGIDVKKILRSLIEQLVDLSVTEKELRIYTKERLATELSEYLTSDEVEKVIKNL